MKKLPYNKEEVKAFIKQWLENISVRYPHLKLKYYHEKWDDTHYIFVDPIEEYTHGQFGKEATEFDINQLLKKYPDELLAFIPMSEYNPDLDKPLLFESTNNFSQLHLSKIRKSLKNFLPISTSSLKNITQQKNYQIHFSQSDLINTQTKSVSHIIVENEEYAA